jgi:hypothetical protein
LSQQIAKVTKKWNEEIFVGCKAITTTSKLFSHLKDKRESSKLADVIYSFPCIDCLPLGGRIYIGKTHQLLEQRARQHQYLFQKLEQCKTIKSKSERQAKEEELAAKSAALHHAITHQHTFDVKKIEILKQCQGYRKLSTLEMLYIKDDPRSVNHRQDVEFLSRTYSNILRRINIDKLRK